MLREMAGMGFEYVELSHGIRIALVPGILRAVEEGVVKVSSTHNFCPLPIGVSHAAPNLFEPSAPTRQEREQWVHHTRRSIDFAARVQARTLVCHLGRIRFFWFNPARTLERAVERAGPEKRRTLRHEKSYLRRLHRARARLRRRMPEFWARTRACVQEVLGYAQERNVTLAFENRERFDELPLDEDFESFLASFPPEARVGYWHDTGHAQIKERMGVLDHREHLQRLADRAVGFHLHDVNAAGRDHQALGEGEIDFATVSRFWRPHHLLTIELSPRVSAEAVHVSQTQIETLLSQTPR
jgi:sugar phosphate isomerase/epimerase